MAKKPTEKAEAKSAEPSIAVKAKKTTAKKTTTKKSAIKEVAPEVIETESVPVAQETAAVVEETATVAETTVDVAVVEEEKQPKVEENNKVEKIYVEEGTVEFFNNKLLILSSTATKLDKLSKESIAKMLEDSKNLLQSSEIQDKEKYILTHKLETLQQIN